MFKNNNEDRNTEVRLYFCAVAFADATGCFVKSVRSIGDFSGYKGCTSRERALAFDEPSRLLMLVRRLHPDSVFLFFFFFFLHEGQRAAICTHIYACGRLERRRARTACTYEIKRSSWRSSVPRNRDHVESTGIPSRGVLEP